MPETSGENDRLFPLTAWTMVLAARDPAAPETVAAREELCRAYWQPVVRYLRALGMSTPDSEDGAQEIMAQLFSRDGVRMLDRQRGRLRHYLKSSARHFYLNTRRDAVAKKRGGGEVLALEEVPESAQVRQEPEDESAFDKDWAHTLCARAMRSLEESYTRRNKAELFAALKPGLVLNVEVQPYAAIGALYGVTDAQIRIEVHRMRKRLADFLRAEVAGTLGPEAAPKEIEEETRYLVRTLAHERRA